MKKILISKAFILALSLSAISGTASAQNDADPAITSFSFDASPIVMGHATTLDLLFLNNGFTTSIPPGALGLKVSLLATGEYVADPENIAAISGNYAAKFNWSYNSNTKTFTGVSNQMIAPGDGGTITVNVKGVNVVGASSSVNATATIQLLDPAAFPSDNSNDNLTTALEVVPTGPLAISLLNFNAVKQSNTVQLNWKTASEVNSKYFEAQYSKDGFSWISIGTVAAAGNSSVEKNYSLIHGNPSAGSNYYRLKQVDINGDFVYTDIREINFSSGTGIKILPNPVVSKLYLNSNTATTFKSVILLTAEGKQLEQHEKFISGNSLDMSKYPPAVYTVKITDMQGNIEVRQVVKNK